MAMMGCVCVNVCMIIMEVRNNKHKVVYISHKSMSLALQGHFALLS